MIIKGLLNIQKLIFKYFVKFLGDYLFKTPPKIMPVPARYPGRIASVFMLALSCTPVFRYFRYIKSYKNWKINSKEETAATNVV